MKRISVTPRHIPGCSVSKFDYVPCQAELSSYIDYFHKQLHEDIENNRLKQIRDRLRAMGHTFSEMSMLREYLSQSATIITFPNKPDYREMYLFYGTKDQVTVGAWWETYEYVENFDYPERGLTISVIAGKPPQY